MMNVHPFNKLVHNQQNPKKAVTLKIIKRSNDDVKKFTNILFVAAMNSTMCADQRARPPEEKGLEKNGNFFCFSSIIDKNGND
jgi:hypothetical protein